MVACTDRTAEELSITRGCPFGIVGNEVTENDELIRQDLSLIFEVVKNKLAAFFIKEKAKGRLAKQANEERMADFCIATIQGAMLMGKIKRNSQTVETVVEEALAHLGRHAVTPKPSPSVGHSNAVPRGTRRAKAGR